MTEGYNANGHVANSQHHVKGMGALDVQIIDPTGKPIPNQGEDKTGMYSRLATLALAAQQKYPEVAGKLAWGGYFETKPGSGTRDLMHFDLGGPRGRYLSGDHPSAAAATSPAATTTRPVPPDYAGQPDGVGVQGSDGNVWVKRGNQMVLTPGATATP